MMALYVILAPFELHLLAPDETVDDVLTHHSDRGDSRRKEDMGLLWNTNEELIRVDTFAEVT